MIKVTTTFSEDTLRSILLDPIKRKEAESNGWNVVETAKAIGLMKHLKVCPSCGSCPWDFHNPGINQENQPEFCQDCGERLVNRSELPRDIWKDPYVKEALKDGRQAFDIAVCRCPKCHQLGYYNEGSTFSCRFCDVTFRMDEELCDEAIRLSDTVTECTDGYFNATT